MEGYYELNTSLIMRFQMQLETIENMFPFERDIYIIMIKDVLEKAKQQAGE